tara:strand:- start:11595 stop:12143 length:549 start_codon:yes stop_codon:yes gene_type:complete
MKNKESFFNNYFLDLNRNIENVDLIKLEKFYNLIKKINKNKNKVIIVGNGGSAAIASHVSVDLTKVAKVRCINFNESDLITCYANDYGYENWVSQSLESYADKNDLVILISSSGNSKNIINAAKKSLEMKLKLVTFSGFKKNNKLSSYGDLNFWVNSSSYNKVEMTHHIWLLSVVDLLADSL